MNDEPVSLTIGTFAKQAGVNVETIRFYQRKKLLPTPQRLYGHVRRYDNADVERVGFIKRAQRLGFSLDEIAELLKLEDGTHCDEAAEMATLRLADVHAKLADLTRIEVALSKLVIQCHARHGDVSCPLIAALHCR